MIYLFISFQQTSLPVINAFNTISYLVEQHILFLHYKNLFIPNHTPTNLYSHNFVRILSDNDHNLWGHYLLFSLLHHPVPLQYLKKYRKWFPINLLAEIDLRVVFQSFKRHSCLGTYL